MSHPDLSFERQDEIAIVRLERPAKRNALNDGLIFQDVPERIEDRVESVLRRWKESGK